MKLLDGTADRCGGFSFVDLLNSRDILRLRYETRSTKGNGSRVASGDAALTEEFL
jgi:hypothetical protein